jgi:hypothetical protein
MSFGSIPDIEQSVVRILSESSLVINIAGVDAVSTELPPDANLPRVRITLSGGTPAVTGWLQAPRINIEAWADNKEEAFDLINACAVTLTSLQDGTQVTEGVITSVRQETGLSWSPDPVTNKARYLLGFVIHIHP